MVTKPVKEVEEWSSEKAIINSHVWSQKLWALRNDSHPLGQELKELHWWSPMCRSLGLWFVRQNLQAPAWVGVLVQAAPISYQRLGGSNNKCLFLNSLKARSLRPGCKHGSGWRLPSWLCPHMAFPWYEHTERAQALSCFFLQRLLSHHVISALWPDHPSKTSSPNIITLGIKLSTNEF